MSHLGTEHDSNADANGAGPKPTNHGGMRETLVMILFWVAIVGWALFISEHHRLSRYKDSRTDVKTWSGLAYEVGYNDCRWPTNRGTNKDFAVDGVLAAYDGAFK